MPVIWLNRTLFFILLFICWPSVAALEIEVAVDRNPIIVNESFNLTVTANEDLPNWSFNSEPLLKDFVVGATSSEKSRSLIQGKSIQTTRWRVRLTAQQPGQYTIPSFDIQGYRTQPLNIEVIKATASAAGENRPYFIQSTLSNETPYVQQQVIYKIDLYLQTSVSLDSGSISTPEAEHTDIQLITQNRERQEIINGQRYRVITQEYAITPQRSGPLTIKGAAFNGITRSSNSPGFMGFSRQEQVTLLTPEIVLEVQAKPAHFPGDWFISEQVSITEQWDSDRAVFPIGEPVTRTITLTAEGVSASQLPELRFDWPTELRVYPERPQNNTSSVQGTRISQARYNIVFIPAQAGTVTLPAIEVPWFNSRTGKTEFAKLPARDITLVAPAGGIPSPQAVAPSNEQHTTVEQPSLNASTSAAPSSNDSKPSRWAEQGLIAMSVLWFITIGWLIWYVQKVRQTTQLASVDNNKVPVKARDALNKLKKACHTNNSKKAMETLILWQKARHNGSGSLRTIRQEFTANTVFMQALDELEASLYSPAKNEWSGGKALWTAIAHLHSAKNAAPMRGEQPLYPH